MDGGSMDGSDTRAAEEPGAPSAGPVELVVIAIPDLSATAHLAEGIRHLVESGSIRILDIVVIETRLGGTWTVLEFEEIAGLAPLQDVEGEVGDWLTPDDIALTSAALPAGTTAVLLVAEDTWAAPLADAVRECGGRILGGERIPTARITGRRGTDEA